jgi:hypothetical protein
MHEAITMAREALMLFLQSLDFGCNFNICSYGSSYEFMFKNQRSVPNNKENISFALNRVKTFEADFGGTEIYQPIDAIFK